MVKSDFSGVRDALISPDCSFYMFLKNLLRNNTRHIWLVLLIGDINLPAVPSLALNKSFTDAEIGFLDEILEEIFRKNLQFRAPRKIT